MAHVETQLDTDDWREIRQEKQGHRNKQRAKNTELIRASGLEFSIMNAGEHIVIPSRGLKPTIDFWPSSGRWRQRGVDQTFNGGAKSLLNWYAKR